MAQTSGEASPKSRQAASIGEAVFDVPTVLTISAAHLAHDIYASFLAPLLPVLIARLNIPMAAAGLLPSVYRAGSLVQPFTGLWADRSDPRYFLVATPTITALTVCLLGVAPSYPVVVLLLALGGLSHASFHPAASAAVTRASGRLWGKGAALFMVGGNLGFAIGPIYIVSIVTWLGLERSYLAAIPAVIFSLLLYARLRQRGTPRMGTRSVPSVWRLILSQRRSILLLSGFVLFRSTTSVSFSTFYPTHVTNIGSSLLFAGFAMTLYQLSAAGGSLVGGVLSDKLGRRAMLVTSQLLSGPLL